MSILIYGSKAAIDSFKTSQINDGNLASSYIKDILINMGIEIILDYIIFSQSGEEHVLNELSKIQTK